MHHVSYLFTQKLPLSLDGKYKLSRSFSAGHECLSGGPAGPCHGVSDSLYSLRLALSLTYAYSAGDAAAEAAKTKIARGDGVLSVAG